MIANKLKGSVLKRLSDEEFYQFCMENRDQRIQELVAGPAGRTVFRVAYLSSQFLNTFTFSRLTSTWASGAVGFSTVCRRELV